MENQNLSPQQQKELDTVTWRLKFQQEVQEHLQNNPDIQNYFKDYNEQSVKQFITSYSVQKSYWYQYGELQTQLPFYIPYY
ncbi:MAG: hypothetical protein ACXVBJ_06625 [Flavisolibacter sp.]